MRRTAGHATDKLFKKSLLPLIYYDSLPSLDFPYMTEPESVDKVSYNAVSYSFTFAVL